jgi:murein DD-endopeptidase MepM/ murein hydrolase activator NlpD
MTFDRPRRRGRFRRVLALAALAVVAFLLVSLFYFGPQPAVSLAPKLPAIGRKTPIEIHVERPERVTRLRIEVVQGRDAFPVLEESYTPRPLWKLWGRKAPLTATAEAGRETVPGLRAGKATIRATAERAGSWLRTPSPVVAEKELPVRLAPPQLSIASTLHYVAQGGCEAVVYRVGETAVRHGVEAGQWWFPGFSLPGESGNAGLELAFFAVPYDMVDPSAVRLVAADDVGNRAALKVIDRFTPRPVKTDTIAVTDPFLARVVPEILANSPAIADRGSLVESYLAINRELRRRNGQTLRELAARSARTLLWSEPFLPMRNAAVTAAFADRRTYVYDGKPIDQQDHLGFDLASVERDAVLASNRGKVVLARYFGIYGNAVVIDHGLGLQSLYGHLSSIAVAEGQEVERGQELGRSGQTGLAGGDHLHFTLLLQGLPVTPVEWWDPHWLEDRIFRKLGPPSPATTPTRSRP